MKRRNILVVVKKPATIVAKKAQPAKQVIATKTRETRANFHVRWDEALFLAVVDVTILPFAHELWHVVAHGAMAIVR